MDDARWADLVVAMGCGGKCPSIPGRRYVDRDLADRKGRPIAEVRAMREEVTRPVTELAQELDATE